MRVLALAAQCTILNVEALLVPLHEGLDPGSDRVHLPEDAFSFIWI